MMCLVLMSHFMSPIFCPFTSRRRVIITTFLPARNASLSIEPWKMLVPASNSATGLQFLIGTPSSPGKRLVVK